jgi:hypothetical protein
MDVRSRSSLTCRNTRPEDTDSGQSSTRASGPASARRSRGSRRRQGRRSGAGRLGCAGRGHTGESREAAGAAWPSSRPAGQRRSARPPSLRGWPAGRRGSCRQSNYRADQRGKGGGGVSAGVGDRRSKGSERTSCSCRRNRADRCRGRSRQPARFRALCSSDRRSHRHTCRSKP